MDVRPLRMLSGAEIVAKGRNVTDCILPEVGIKEVSPNGSWLETKQIQTALEARKVLVAAERIDKIGALSHAEWNDSLKLAEVTQQVGGHWQFMGHNVNGTFFLLPEEALYLMETNCLLLKHNEVTVSLQKAYNLLLGEHITLEQYKVYALLSRVGYKVFRHEKRKPSLAYSIKKRILQHEKLANIDTCVNENPNFSENIPFVKIASTLNGNKNSNIPENMTPVEENDKNSKMDICGNEIPNITENVSLEEVGKIAIMDTCGTENPNTPENIPLIENPKMDISNENSNIPEKIPLIEDKKIAKIDTCSNENPNIPENIPLVVEDSVSKNEFINVNVPNKESRIVSSKPLPHNVNIVLPNNKKNGPVQNGKQQDSAIFSIDDHGVIHVISKDLPDDRDMETVSSATLDSATTSKNSDSKKESHVISKDLPDDKDMETVSAATLDSAATSKNSDSKKESHLQNIYRVIQNKIKNRKIQPSDPKSIHEKFKAIPDCYNQWSVTVKVPSKDYLPRNISLENKAYVINLKNVKSKRRNSTSDAPGRNRAMDRTIRSSTESESAAIPLPELPQFVPNTPPFQQPFGYFPNWWPRFQPFQNPVFPIQRFNQHPFFYRMMHYLPSAFNSNRQRVPFNQNQNNMINQQQYIKKEQLHSIKQLAQRLQRFRRPPNTNLNSLKALVTRFNVIYNERIQITRELHIIGDQDNVGTITLNDDEEINEPKHSEKFDQYLKSVKELAARLKTLERMKQSTSKHKRAFSKLLKHFNKEFDTEFSLDSKGELIDEKLVVVNSSSDSEDVATDVNTNKARKRSSTDDNDQTKKKKPKIHLNPFSILKGISEGTSEAAIKSTAPETAVDSSTDLTKYFDKNWLRNDDDFGKPACSKMYTRHFLVDSEHLYGFIEDSDSYKNWIDLKSSYCEHMEAVFALENDLTAHCRDLTVDNSRLKPLLQQDVAVNWEFSSEKLRIIKTNTDIQETSLRIHFDVYNRDVQNFRKTDPPKPHFRIVCVDESSKFPSGAEVRALHEKVDDSVAIVFAVASIGSVTYIQMNPTDLPVYVGDD